MPQLSIPFPLHPQVHLIPIAVSGGESWAVLLCAARTKHEVLLLQTYPLILPPGHLYTWYQASEMCSEDKNKEDKLLHSTLGVHSLIGNGEKITNRNSASSVSFCDKPVSLP